MIARFEAMNPFIMRPGLQALPTPYIVDRSRTAAFAVPTPAGKIQQLLDATLNAVAGSPRFTPLLDCMVLTFIHYPDVHAAQAAVPPAARTGFFDYEECAIFLPIRDARGDGLGTCWHVPMLLLNQVIPLILGREVFGMPKVFGRIDTRPLQVDDWLANPAGTLKVATEGFPQQGSAVGITFVNVAEVTFKGPHLRLPLDLPVRALDPLGLLHFAADAIEDIAHLRPVMEFFQSLVSVGFPGIFLKQFPDGSGTQQTVYQRLLKAAFTPTAISAPTYVVADVTVFDPPSYPLASTFGLTAGVAKTAIGIVAEISWELPPPVEI
jgi:hypothetical protein